jgi:hypothetical protein
MFMKKNKLLSARKFLFVLTLTGLTAISANIAFAQKPEGDARETPVAITQEPDVELLERRIQKLELLDRQRRSDEAKEKQSQQLEGSWDVDVTPVLPPGAPPLGPFRAHSTFSRGGTVIGSDRGRPFSKQHGNWEYLGGDDFVYTITEDLYDATGTFIGVLKVRVRLSVISGDEYIGVANGEQRDAEGNLVFNRCSTIKGQRIAIEALPPQCVNIVPPR